MKWLLLAAPASLWLAATLTLDISNAHLREDLEATQHSLDETKAFVLEYREELARVRGHCDMIDLESWPKPRKGI